MIKKSLLAASIIALGSNAFAGGYLTNTNQSINFLRNPARDASIGIDGVYYNPAGTVFYNDGFHIQFNWQNAYQKRDAYATYGQLFKYNYGNPSLADDAGREFKGRVEVPIQPSLFAVYNTGDWSFQFGFGFLGGGGACEYEHGVGMFEALVGSTGLELFKDKFAGYSLDSYVKGTSYYMGGSFAVAHKFSETFSVSVGIRGMYVSNNYEGYIRDMKYRMLTGVAEPAYVEITKKEKPKELADLELDCDQTAFGIAPIVGVDWKIAPWVNLAAKFEFKTKLRAKTDAHNNQAFDTLAGSNPAFASYLDGAKTPCDVPAIGTIGFQFTPVNKLRLDIGYHHYFDMDTKQMTKSMVGNTQEILCGIEYDINRVFEISAGYQKSLYDQTDENISDMSFSLTSYCLGAGIGIRLSPTIKLNAAYFQTFYDDYTKETPVSKTVYSRTNRVIGVGIDINF